MLHHLLAHGGASVPPEADVDLAGCRAVQGREHGVLTRCASGRELIEGGQPADVDIAAEVGGGGSVPLLRAGRFSATPSH